MPKKTVVVDYHACDPNQCENGICKAALVCERKVLTQEAPYEMPDAKASMCLSCSLCVLECPKSAIHVQ
jgi:Fe-S-cluster-containing hydrogenase component 2